MSITYTEHERLIKSDAGDIDWDTTVNSNLSGRERGRHLYRYSGEYVSSTHVVALESTSGYMMRTNVTSGEEHFLGVCYAAISSLAQGQVTIFGNIEHDSWTWDIGKVYPEYTGGGGLVQSGYLTSLLGSYSIPVAYAHSETKLFLARGMVDHKLGWGMSAWDYHFYVQVAGTNGHANSNHQHVFPHNVGCFIVNSLGNSSNTVFVVNSYLIAGDGGDVICISPGHSTSALAMASDKALYISQIDSGSGFWVKTANNSDFGTDANEHYLYQFFR